MKMDFKYVPLTFISTNDAIEEQVKNTVIFKTVLSQYENCVPLSDLITSTQYGYTASAKSVGTHKLLRITDIKNGVVDWNRVPFCECYRETTYSLNPGDVLIARTGNNISYLVDAKVPCQTVFASYLIRITCDKQKLLPEYLYLFLNSYAFWPQILLKQRGALLQNVNANLMKQLLVPMCPIAVQKAIVDSSNNILSEKILKEQHLIIALFRRSKQLSSELSHQLNLLRKLRQQLLQDAVQGKLIEQDSNDEPASVLLQKIKAEKEQLVKDKKLKKERELRPIKAEEIPFAIPEKWVWCRLGEVCTKIGSGSTPKGSDYSQTGIPFFRSQNIYETGLIYDDIKFISEKVHLKMSGTTVYANDILLNITGGSLGRSVKVPKDFNEGNVSQHVCIIRALNVNEAFLHKITLSPFFQNLIFSSTTGAGREGLPKYNLEQFLIPLPPLEEQKRILIRLEQLMNTCDALEANIKQSQHQNAQLLQQVLREALTPPVQPEIHAPEANVIQLTPDEKYKSLLLAAEIIWQLNQQPTLGRLKLQKLIFLCDRTQQMHLPITFLKQAMGPYSFELETFLETELSERHWFKLDEKATLKFKPLKNAGGHKADFVKYFEDEIPAINHLIQLFENARSAQIEVVATLFACWEEMIADHQLVNDESLLHKFYNWHEKKQKHSKEKVINALRWMEEQEITPKSK